MGFPVERDADGRFRPGNRGGPGREPLGRELEYLKMLQKICTLERWEVICQRAVLDAANGDPRARSFLADYLLGRPVQTITHREPDRVESERDHDKHRSELRELITKLRDRQEAAIAKPAGGNGKTNGRHGKGKP